MAWQMNFTGAFEENYPQSYWRVVQCNLNKETQTGRVTFNGYATQNDAGKRIIGQKNYDIAPDLYQRFFLPDLIQPQGVDHLKQCYALAIAVLDVDSGTQDAEGNAIFASFFNNGAEI